EGEPIAGALIEIWQADDDGEYDNDPKHKPADFRFRASMDAGKKGEYAYDTIVPAAYEIGPKMYRPKHIHYKITARGVRTLSTQLPRPSPRPTTHSAERAGALRARLDRRHLRTGGDGGAGGVGRAGVRQAQGRPGQGTPVAAGGDGVRVRGRLRRRHAARQPV